MNCVGAYIQTLRPHQWVKNALLFVPMLTAHAFNGSGAAWLCVAVAAFSLTASASYLANDLIDLKADRRHRTKRFRPLARGAVPVTHAQVMMPLLLAAGVGLAGAVSPAFLLCVGLYVAATAAYSLMLKRLPIVDVLTLAGLYTLRVVAGGVALEIPVSAWLLAFCLFLFLYLALIKRLTELRTQRDGADPAEFGRGYRADDLPLLWMLGVASGFASVLVLALYVNSPIVTVLYHHPEGLWAVCVLLLYWISRTLLITHRGEMRDDPVLFVLEDRVSLAVLGAIVLVSGGCAL